MVSCTDLSWPPASTPENVTVPNVDLPSPCVYVTVRPPTVNELAAGFTVTTLEAFNASA